MNDDRPIQEQIKILHAKLQLLEGDSKAFYETSQNEMYKNREVILKLRKETKELRKKLNDSLQADDHVIREGLRNSKATEDRKCLRNKTGPAAIDILNNRKGDQRKKLDLLRHKVIQKQKLLENLQHEYEVGVREQEQIAATDKRESEIGRAMRDLENKFDKAQLKCNEAEHVKRMYMDMKHKLKEDSMLYPNQIDSLERKIREADRELQDVSQINTESAKIKEHALEDLKEEEERIYRERKEREQQLLKTRKEAEEVRAQHERVERRLTSEPSKMFSDKTVQRAGSVHGDEGIIREETQMPAPGDNDEGAEDSLRLQAYRDAFDKIKDACGVFSIQEVLRRFANQEDTRQHLEELQHQHRQTLERMKEEREKLQREYEDMKYTGEAKISSGQKLLEEYKDYANEAAEQERLQKEALDYHGKILIKVKSGVEHLYERLKHVKTGKIPFPAVTYDPASNEYILDLLEKVEERMHKLSEEMKEKDLKVVNPEEVQQHIESNLPKTNFRAKMPQAKRDLPYDELGSRVGTSSSEKTRFILKRDGTVAQDDESQDEGDSEIKSRAQMKQNAHQMASEGKKRQPKGKNKRK